MKVQYDLFQNKSPFLSEVQLIYKSKILPSDRTTITCSTDSYNYLKSIYGEEIEHVEYFYVLLLNRANQILGWHQVSKGGVAGTVADPKVIMQAALLANASSVILAHNHPSGNYKPSAADIKLTKNLKEGAKMLDIVVMDHMIITTETYYSFADEGEI